MECTLMHNKFPVVDLEILSDTGRIVRIFNPQTTEHLPLGIKTKDGISRKAMDDWWTGRSIPTSRDGIREVLDKLGVYNTSVLIDKCFGLSLSDQYWICPKGSGFEWNKINFFHNDYSKDMGEILFGREPAAPDNINLVSPDNTTDGWLRKKWTISDGKHTLMKGGSGVYEQEPFNEVIASAVMRRLNIPHVEYTLIFDKGKPYSLCENFITPETELIPAWRVKEALKKDNRDSDYTHILRCCETLGIPGVSVALDKILVLDYIISNEDRHYNNFGFIRNPETLEWLGLAPVFDSGTSLWHNTRFVGRDIECKPFRKSHNEQIKLVSDWSCFNPDALCGLGDEIAEILSQSEAVDSERHSAITAAVTERCGKLEKLAKEKPSLLGSLNENKRRIAEMPGNPTDNKHENEIT